MPDAQATAMRAVKRAAESHQVARDRLRAAIIVAWEAGVSLRDVAAAAGVSHTTVRNIVQGR